VEGKWGSGTVNLCDTSSGLPNIYMYYYILSFLNSLFYLPYIYIYYYELLKFGLKHIKYLTKMVFFKAITKSKKKWKEGGRSVGGGWSVGGYGWGTIDFYSTR